jgi:MarR family transcriptional regulator, transcriptional regulator for hemolysin
MKSAAFHPVGRDLVFTAKALREAFEDALARSGGSLGTWIILNAVSTEGVVNQSVLASHAHVEGATMTHHIDHLEKLGLVRRVADPADRRVRKIEPTPEGVALHKRMLAEAKKFEAKTFAGVTDEERVVLRDVLDRIKQNLEG